MKPFVGVVASIHALPVIAPVQGAIRAYVAVDELAGGIVELGNQRALLQCPVGRGQGGVDANGWHKNPLHTTVGEGS
jgi:hypothetical protein